MKDKTFVKEDGDLRTVIYFSEFNDGTMIVCYDGMHYDDITPTEAKALWLKLIHKGYRFENAAKRRKLLDRMYDIIEILPYDGTSCDVCGTRGPLCDCFYGSSYNGSEVTYWSDAKLESVVTQLKVLAIRSQL